MDAKAPTLGKLIDNICAIRDKKRKAQAVVDDLSAQYSEAEAALMQRLEAEGVSKSSGKTATASISEVTVAQVEDWEKFYTFIYKQKFGHLLQRRVSDPAFREVLALMGEKKLAAAGVTPFTKKNLNLRAL